MRSTKLSHTNPYLRDPAMRKRGLLISAASSSAIEGIHAPFKNALASAKRDAVGAAGIPRKSVTRHSPGSPAAARIGALAFIHRFGSSLNEHIHFHCSVIDGVFAPAADTDDALDYAPSVSFHVALELDAAAFADVQARVRTGVLRTFVRRGLIDKDDATEMRAWAHDGGL